MSSTPSVVKSDFNGDGQADILWQNAASGARAIWFMNGTTFGSSSYLPAVATSWSIAGSGDFNGDGQTDILWQNTSGARLIWLMDGAVRTGSVSLGTVATSWSIVGGADFNGDGQTDILWQNTNGSRAVWFMNGTSFVSSVYLPFAAASWSIVGSAISIAMANRILFGKTRRERAPSGRVSGWHGNLSLLHQQQRSGSAAWSVARRQSLTIASPIHSIPRGARICTRANGGTMRRGGHGVPTTACRTRCVVEGGGAARIRGGRSEKQRRRTQHPSGQQSPHSLA